MNKFISSFIFFILFFLFSCNSESKSVKKNEYNSLIGIGPFKEMSFDPNDKSLQKKGKQLYIKFCVSCHLYKSKHSIGPTWDSITKRLNPVWILNFVSNTEEMLNFDPYLKKQIKKYSLKMPTLNIDTSDAKAIYSFMYFKDNELYRKD